MRTLILFICALLLCVMCALPALGDGPGQSHTPSRSGAALFQPYEYELGDQDQARAALDDQHYTLYPYANPDTSIYPYPPNPTLAQWVAEVGANRGAMFHGGHANENGIAIEVYPHTPRGHRLATQAINNYNSQGYNGKLFFFADEDSAGYAVALYWSAIPALCHFANAVVDIETCCSTYSGAWTGARVEFVNDCDLDWQSSNQNTIALWGGMDGTAGGGWPYRTARWAYVVMSPHCTMRERQMDGGYTTLAPCAKWTNATPGDLIPSDGTTIQLLFDTHVNMNIDPSVVWRADGGVFTIDSSAWAGDTLLTAHIVPTSEYGQGTLVAQQAYVTSADCSDLHLDGDAQGGPSDWAIEVNNDDDPAATIDGVRWKAGTFTWFVCTEMNTKDYRIEGRNPPETTWTQVGDLQPPGVGVRSMYVGAAFQEYRVVEVESNGHERPGNVVGTAAPDSLPIYPHRSLSELQAALRAAVARGPAGGRSTEFNGEKIAVFTPSAWQSDVNYLMQYLAGWYGLTYQTITIEQFGAPENRYAGIKGCIGQLYSQGYRYVLLVGDASDWQYFDGPYTPEYWPDQNWEEVRQEYFTDGYPHGGDPSLNMIPAIEAKDPADPGLNVAYYRPYYELSDMIAYGDVDGDGLPDLAVGRWPFDDEEEVAAACYKTLTYIDQGGQYDQPITVNVFLGDGDVPGPGDGQRATDVMNAIKSQFGPHTNFRQVLQSQYPEDGQRLVAAVNAWNDQAEVALFAALGSGRYFPGDFFNLSAGFTIGMIESGTFPELALGASCDTGDEFMTQDPYWGTSVAHRFLAADGCGAMFWIGPSAATTQGGNMAIGTAIAANIQQDLSRPVGESTRLAIRQVLTTTPPDDTDIIEVAKEYQFLGFPLAPLDHIYYVVGVNPARPEYALSLAPASPNPARGRTSITFTLPAAAEVSVRAFDVGGRLVDTIARGPFGPGVHTLRWTPDHRIPSGQYYLKLETGGRALTRRLTLAR